MHHAPMRHYPNGGNEKMNMRFQLVRSFALAFGVGRLWKKGPFKRTKRQVSLETRHLSARRLLETKTLEKLVICAVLFASVLSIGMLGTDQNFLAYGKGAWTTSTGSVPPEEISVITMTNGYGDHMELTMYGGGYAWTVTMRQWTEPGWTKTITGGDGTTIELRGLEVHSEMKESPSMWQMRVAMWGIFSLILLVIAAAVLFGPRQTAGSLCNQTKGND